MLCAVGTIFVVGGVVDDDRLGKDCMEAGAVDVITLAFFTVTDDCIKVLKSDVFCVEVGETCEEGEESDGADDADANVDAGADGVVEGNDNKEDELSGDEIGRIVGD